MTVGSGDTGNGGALVLSAGTTSAGAGTGSGGLVTIKTGYSSTASSGNLLLQTANAGMPYLVPLASAISGYIVMSTGTASAGNSGSIFIGSGTPMYLACLPSLRDVNDVLVPSSRCGVVGTRRCHIHFCWLRNQVNSFQQLIM